MVPVGEIGLVARMRVVNRWSHPRRSAATAVVTIFSFDAGMKNFRASRLYSVSPVRSDTTWTPQWA